MPLIECMIDRDGPTPINDGGFTFVFKENDAGHRVANVLSEGTAARLLSFKWFRIYNPEQDYPPEPQSPGPEPTTDGDDRILLLRDEGHSIRAIASATGRSTGYIQKVINSRQ